MWPFWSSPLPYWSVLIFAPPGQGKSLEIANISVKVLHEYVRTEKKYPWLMKRVLLTNMELNHAMLPKKVRDENFLAEHIRYWKTPQEFRYCPRTDCHYGPEEHDIHDVDIFIDEAGAIFPSDSWGTTPQWLRELWMQHRKRGIRLLTASQDYMMVDINARRVLWKAYYLKKIMGSRDPSPTMPALARWTIKNFLNPKERVIWGIYWLRPFSPLVLKFDEKSLLLIEIDEFKKEQFLKAGLMKTPIWRLITWKKISWYETRKIIKSWERPKKI